MIIQCPKCLTKFKLDDSKISDEGTRVRCTKCKEVFVAKRETAPPPPPPPVQPEIPEEKDEFDFSFGPTFGEEEKEAEKKEEAPSQFGGGFGEEETPKKEEFIDETPFSFGETSPEEPKMPGKEEAGFDWGGSMSYGEVNLSDSGTETAESPLGFDYKKEEETPFGGFEFKEEPGNEPSPEPSFVAPAAPSFAPPLTSELPKFKEREEVQSPQPPAEAYEERPIGGIEEEGFSEEFPEEFKKAERTPFLKKGVITFLIIAVLAIGGWSVWKNYKASESGVINLEEMNGYYTQNAEAGNIFVVSGRAVNNTNKARSFFQVKGVLFNKQGEKLAQKEVFCGNIFSSKELTTLSREKIEADLMNKVGGSLSNINLAPGKSVPFMIVFFDLPPDMSEFSVESTGSHLASE